MCVCVCVLFNFVLFRIFNNNNNNNNNNDNNNNNNNNNNNDMGYSFQLAGQVSVFNVHIQSKLLWCTPVTGTGTSLCRFHCPGQKKKEGSKGEGVRGTTYTGGYKRVQAVRLGSVAGKESFIIICTIPLP